MSKIKKAKAAKLHVPCVEFTCAYCGEYIDSGEGHMWASSDVSRAYEEGLWCFSCKEWNRIPKQAFKVLGFEPGPLSLLAVIEDV